MSAVFPALANGAILSALLTAALWLALRLIPRRVLNAATRYAVWWAALAVVVAMPAVFLRPPPAMPPTYAGSAASAPPGTPISGLAAPRYLAAPPPGNANLRIGVFRLFAWPQFPIEISAGKWPRWVMCLWLGVGAIMLIRLAASWILLGRFCARASDPPEALRTRAAHWLALCGSKRRNVRVVCSTETAIPAAVGPLRPAIVIPARLLNELDENALDQIGLHEAAHLARRDDYALAVQRILEALFAPHPVVRWIARRIDLEREIACDDFVLAAKGQSKSYAWCLTRMAELTVGASPSPAAAAATSNLARRVDMLLDKTRHTGTRVLRARLAVVIAALAALVWVAGRSPSLLAFAAPPVQTAPQTAPSHILAPMPARAAEIPQRPASDKPPAATAPPEIAATVALQTERAAEPIAAPPAFEVASVKRVDGFSGALPQLSPGRVSLPFTTLNALLMTAYGVKHYQIDGAAWLDSEHYEVTAKIPDGASREQVPAMLQRLLTERFGLKLHWEAKVEPVYALVVGPNGAKLKASDETPPLTTGGANGRRPGSVSMTSSGHVEFWGVPIARFADNLGGFVDRPVVDMTGLEGDFDIVLNIEAGDRGLPKRPSADGAAPVPDESQPASVFGAVRSLGLRLEARKAPIRHLVVDQAEKVPTEN